MDDTNRIITSLDSLAILIDRVSETVKLEIKIPEGEFLGMLLRTLVFSILGNMLTGIRVVIVGKGALRAGR